MDFNRISNKLHEQAVSSKFTEWPVMDGDASIVAVDIVHGEKLTVRFQLYFLAPCYFVTPAVFTVVFDDESMRSGTAKYGCGTLNEIGQFLTADSKNCMFPIDESEWAVSASCRFGDTGLGGWLNAQSSRR